MSETESKQGPSVLVLLATGKLGSGVVDAFVGAKDNYKVFGTSRNGKNPTLLAKGVTPIAFRYGDKESIGNALTVSKPQIVVVITHSFISKLKEADHGKLILDACQEKSIPHVIFAASDLVDLASEKASHIYSKRVMEDYMQGLELKCWSVVRPPSFMENFDDPTVHNPLCRGSLTDLYEGGIKVNHVACLDVGKAAVAMAKDPAKWKGKKLTCITSRDTGEDLASILSEVSGIPCTYQATPPRFILKYVLSNLYHMVDVCRENDSRSWTQEIEDFKQVVPNAMNFHTWLKTQQRGWSDGTLFGDPAPEKSFLGLYLGPAAAVLALGIGVAVVSASSTVVS